MEYWMKFLFVFFAVAFADIFWTLYFIDVEQRNSVKAGLWASLIMIMTTFITSSYIHERSFIVAAVLGSFVGTAGIVEWKKKHE